MSTSPSHLARDHAPMVRHTVYYTGRVQGVGFRATTASIASRFDVAGYVRNLDDGRVEIVAEGTPDQVEAFLHEIATQLGRFIRLTQATLGNPTGAYGDPRDLAAFRIDHG